MLSKTVSVLSLLFLPRISFGNKPSIISSREIFFILFWNGIWYCYGMCFLGRQIWHSSNWLLYRDTGVKMYIFSEVFSSFAANSLDYLKWKGDFLKSFFPYFFVFCIYHSPQAFCSVTIDYLTPEKNWCFGVIARYIVKESLIFFQLFKFFPVQKHSNQL